MEELDFCPFNSNDIVLREDNLVVLRSIMNHLCGYAAFSADVIPKEWHGNYNADALQYLNVHGGITYAEVPKEGWVVFGFDCAHVDDDKNPALQNPNYVMELTRQMRQQILDYAAVIEEWREADSKKRCEMMDKIRDAGEHKEHFGFGAMIDLLCGGEMMEEDNA